jgi:hypothetical protein
VSVQSGKRSAGLAQALPQALLAFPWPRWGVISTRGANVPAQAGRTTGLSKVAQVAPPAGWIKVKNAAMSRVRDAFDAKASGKSDRNILFAVRLSSVMKPMPIDSEKKAAIFIWIGTIDFVFATGGMMLGH